jgi:hypothetical protein
MSTNATAAAIAAEAAAKVALTANPGISFGSYILGMWLDAIMGGIMISQLITYFSHSRNERWMIRIIVVSPVCRVWVVVSQMARHRPSVDWSSAPRERQLTKPLQYWITVISIAFTVL